MRIAGFLRVAGILLCASLTANCATSEIRKPTGDLKVFGNLKTIEIAPVLVAADRFYRPATEVKMGGIPNLVGEGSSAESGARADLGTHAETQALRYSMRHPDLRIILNIAEGHYRIVARRSAGIERLSDLKGKRIATYAPTSAGYFLHRMLASVGLDYDDVTIVPLGDITEVPAIMTQHKADAVAIWEPQSENALIALGDDAVEFDGKGIYRELFNLNSTVATLADPGKRRQIVAFVRAIILAARAVDADPRSAWPVVAEAGGFEMEEVARAWEHHAFPANLPTDMLDVLAEEEAWLAEAEGRSPRSREELGVLIDPTILSEALVGL